MSSAYALTDKDDGLPANRRWRAVIAIWIGVVLCVLDTAIANVALPSIASQLRVSAASSIWVINGYQIALTMTMLPLAAMAEIVGYRRVYLAGTVLFVLASAACGIASDLPMLTAARFAQGIGAAGVMGVNPALIRFIYPRDMLGRGMGWNALVVAAASAAGPTLAGIILSVASWRWLFWINLPTGLLSLVLAVRYLPITVRRPGRFDVVSAILSATTFGTIFIAADDAAHGEAGLRAILAAVVTIAAGSMLVHRASTRPAPLFPIDLLRVPVLRSAYGISVLAFAASAMGLIAIPFLLGGRGVSATSIGLLIAPWPITIAVIAPIAGRLSERMSAGLLGALGLATMAGGLALAAFIGTANPVLAGAGCAIAGGGFALFQTPNNRTMLGRAAPERSGAAGGLLATARLVGQTGGAVGAAALFRLLGETSPLVLASAAGIALCAAALSAIR